MQMCIFDDKKICDNCSDCNICDLDENKLCDNCGKCIEVNSEYLEVKVEGILDEETDYEEYIFEEEIDNINDNKSFEKEDAVIDYDDKVEELFIEDIPELREKYYKDLEKIFKKIK